eukprot:2144258-Amphidinium_carterae.3
MKALLRDQEEQDAKAAEQRPNEVIQVERRDEAIHVESSNDDMNNSRSTSTSSTLSYNESYMAFKDYTDRLWSEIEDDIGYTLVDRLYKGVAYTEELDTLVHWYEDYAEDREPGKTKIKKLCDENDELDDKLWEQVQSNLGPLKENEKYKEYMTTHNKAEMKNLIGDFFSHYERKRDEWRINEQSIAAAKLPKRIMEEERVRERNQKIMEEARGRDRADKRKREEAEHDPAMIDENNQERLRAES